MHGYRAYIIGQDGRIKDRVEFHCDDENEAKERAKQLVVQRWPYSLSAG
jgi:hypothetical protein